MTSLESIIIGILGVVVGGLLLYVNRRANRSLVGSFFKNYYDLSMIAIILLIASFLTEFLTFFGIDQEFASVAHHLLLIVAGVVFVFTSITLPKEASSYMKSLEKPEQK
ncbi:MAG: hypothetical protein M1320_00780 [Patescibacteria group bacterium]|nr:hypothetical protein [Patescibacteria group bacterium]